MKDTLPVRVRFGIFELDLRTRELCQGEQPIPLQEQPFQVLLMLVERGCGIVTREEIQKKLWPNDTVVEFDQSINTAIKKLRKALGDAADEPKYIKTLAGHGYRLLVPVERVAVADDSSDSEKIPAQAKEARTGRPRAASLTGKTVSHYRVLEIVGGGGMGVVYRAEDLRLGRAVALKFLPEELGDDPKALERFEREARAASALDHPNICSIYEFGEHEGQPFIVMQLLEGQTLRDHLVSLALQKSGSDGSCPQAFPLDQLLDVGTQIAAGLKAAHECGIIHRDIKPANIFLTTRGLVKILDFGVAKLVEASESEQAAAAPSESGTVSGYGFRRADPDLPPFASGLQPATDSHLTGTGAAMGTAGYMSPEQVRGEKVDPRTDLFSFGLVLYEMATGERAFSGDTAAIVHDAIVKQTPAAAHERNPSIPPKLEHIINHAIEKDRERRYQSATEMRADLESLAARQSEQSGSGKSRIRSRWKWLASAAVVCVAMIASGLYWYWHSRKPVKLTERDTIVLADFDNKTGDAVFNDTLKQALSIQLEQSPFLNVLSAEKVEEMLKLMNRPANERLTRAVAQEVCLRSNSKGLLVGTIAAVGDRYLIGLNALNCQTGDTLASAEAEAENRNYVLQALNRVTSQLREKLGESLASVQKFNQPLEQATTTSLEALQAYTQGRKIANEQGDDAATASFKRAVELDPNFAIAYVSLGDSYTYTYDYDLAMQNYKKAYELRGRVSPRERFNIESAYYYDGSGEIDNAIRTYTEWAQYYPGDYLPRVHLADIFFTLGQYEKAAAEAREAVRLRPGLGSYELLIESCIAMNRLEDAKAALQEAQARNIDAYPLRQMRYYIAFLQGDTESMRAQDAWAMAKPGVEALQLSMQAGYETYNGRLGSATELSLRAEESATRAGERGLVAIFKLRHAYGEAELGDPSLARRAVAEALAMNPGRNEDAEALVALTLARLGEVAQARRLVDKLSQEVPLDTMVQSYSLPAIRAVIELALNDPRRAVEILQVVTPHDLGHQAVIPTDLYPAYVRGLAYLKLGQGPQAAVEFQKVLDHPGIVLFHLHGALARLGLTRAYALEAETEPAASDKARAAYRNFLTLWKDADPDIPIYKQAKAEYARLQ